MLVVPVNNKKEFNNTDGDCSHCIYGVKCQLTAGSDACLNVKQLKPNRTYCSEKDICTKEECPEFSQKINMCGRKIKWIIPELPIE